MGKTSSSESSNANEDFVLVDDTSVEILEVDDNVNIEIVADNSVAEETKVRIC